MNGPDGRSRVRRAAMEWDVPVAARAEDLDERLRAGRCGRTGWMQVLIDHDTPGAGRCPTCGWAATTSRRDCPSRVVAKSLLEGAALPAWLAHLADVVPGARVKCTPASREQQRVDEDEMPGLFAAPARQSERRP